MQYIHCMSFGRVSGVTVIGRHNPQSGRYDSVRNVIGISVEGFEGDEQKKKNYLMTE